MAKYALSEAGVASKLAEVYGLSDPAREAEAAAIKADFKGWLDDNFNLTGPQATYIAGMNEDACDWYGSLCSLCFMHELDIDIVYPSPPPGAIGKWVESEDKTVVKNHPPGGGVGGWLVTGSVTFTIGYYVP